MFRICKFLMIPLLAMALSSCGDKNTDPAPEPTPTPLPEGAVSIADIAGQWQLAYWSVDGALKGNVYLEIKEDMTFVLYQDLVSSGYEKLTGTFTLGENCSISGKYSGGVVWGNTYTITEITKDGMKWSTSEGRDISIYTRATLPGGLEKLSRAAEQLPDERFL